MDFETFSTLVKYSPGVMHLGFAFLIPLLGLALSAVGVGTAVYGAVKSAEASEDAEKARKQQMNLDAVRRRRQAIREAQIARATAVSNASAQGASEGSAVQGGVAALSGNAAESIVNTNQNVLLGNAIYDANGRRAGAESISAIGGGLQQAGSMIMQNASKIRKLPSGLKGVLDPSEEV
jgi:hypothetical protein